MRTEFQKSGLDPEKFTFLNAGYSSYAPSIYIVQMKKLIPKYKPDFVVIDIDESDLIDDSAIYRHLIARDSAGKMAAVHASPPLKMKMEGYAALRNQPFYLIRLLSMWMHKARAFFVFEEYKRKYKGKYLQVPMAETSRRFSFNLSPGYDPAPDPEKKYADEIHYFRNTVEELMQTLIDLMGGSGKILMLYHPHLYQLIPDPNGHLWKPWVPQILAEAAQKHGIDFYDASGDLKTAFVPNPEAFYRKNDMHFNHSGMELYSRFVSQKLRKLGG